MTKPQRWILIIGALAAFMTALDTLVVSTALTTIRSDLGTSVDGLEWTVNAYNLSFAVMIMTAAALGDRYGRRRMFVGGLAVFALASAVCALATDPDMLIAARAVQGVGAAAIQTLALTLVSTAFPPEKRGAALGVFFALNGLAVAGGPLVGGAVTQGISWEWIFWLNVPIGLALIPLALRRVPESRGSDGRLDLPGLALVTAGAFGVVWGLVRANDAGWASAEILGSLLGGAALLAGFVAWQRRASTAMVPLTFFRSRAFSAGNAAIGFAVGGLFCAVFFLSQFIQAGLGSSPLQAGLRLLPWTATLFFTAPIAGKVTDRLGPRPFLILGPLLQAVGMGSIAVLAVNGITYAEMIGPMVVAGIGISMTFPAAQSSVVSAVPPEALGKASGVNSTVRELGGVLGIAIGVAAFAGRGGCGNITHAFSSAMIVSAGLSLCAAAAGVSLPHRIGPRSWPTTSTSPGPMTRVRGREAVDLDTWPLRGE